VSQDFGDGTRVTDKLHWHSMVFMACMNFILRVVWPSYLTSWA